MRAGARHRRTGGTAGEGVSAAQHKSQIFAPGAGSITVTSQKWVCVPRGHQVALRTWGGERMLGPALCDLVCVCVCVELQLTP